MWVYSIFNNSRGHCVLVKLWSRHFSKHLRINPFNSQQFYKLLRSSFYWWGNRYREGVSNFPQVSLLIHDGTEICTQAFWPQKLVSGDGSCSPWNWSSSNASFPACFSIANLSFFFCNVLYFLYNHELKNGSNFPPLNCESVVLTWFHISSKYFSVYFPQTTFYYVTIYNWYVTNTLIPFIFSFDPVESSSKGSHVIYT